MDAAELKSRIQAGREEITSLWSDIDEAEWLKRPGPQEDWSIKDLIAHLTFWERHMIGNVQVLLRGENPPYVSQELDAINERVFLENKDRHLADILQDFDASLKNVLATVDRLTDDDINNPQRFAWTQGEPLLEMIAADTYDHYRDDHLDDVRRWRARITNS
jgi:hypothetical protein